MVCVCVDKLHAMRGSAGGGGGQMTTVGEWVVVVFVSREEVNDRKLSECKHTHTHTGRLPADSMCINHRTGRRCCLLLLLRSHPGCRL